MEFTLAHSSVLGMGISLPNHVTEARDVLFALEAPSHQESTHVQNKRTLLLTVIHLLILKDNNMGYNYFSKSKNELKAQEP